MPKEKKSRILLSAPRLKFDYVRQMAEEFRKKYVDPVDKIPVPILEIVELKLNIHPRPIHNLMSKIDIDGFLTKDLKEICIDFDIYMDDRRLNRLRFTYAHEIGHLVLHKNEIKQCDFRTPEDWIHFHEDFWEDELNWFESQGREFGGRLLVPREKLIEEIENHRDKIDEFKAIVGDAEEGLIEAASGLICKKFQVSSQVIVKRIQKEKIKL